MKKPNRVKCEEKHIFCLVALLFMEYFIEIQCIASGECTHKHPPYPNLRNKKDKDLLSLLEELQLYRFSVYADLSFFFFFFLHALKGITER